jgi:hypothetical protein
MGHSYNHGMVTSMKGPAFEAFRVSAMDASPCTIEEQCASGVVSAVTIASGLVTVQLVAPYPPKLVICQPTYTGTSTTTDIITARYVENSYDATAGTLQIALSNDDDSGAPAAASPAADDELHVFCIFRRYNTL